MNVKRWQALYWRPVCGAWWLPSRVTGPLSCPIDSSPGWPTELRKKHNKLQFNPSVTHQLTPRFYSFNGLISIEMGSCLYHSIALWMLYNISFESNSIRSSVQLLTTLNRRDPSANFVNFAAVNFVWTRRNEMSSLSRSMVGSFPQ